LHRPIETAAVRSRHDAASTQTTSRGISDCSHRFGTRRPVATPCRSTKTRLVAGLAWPKRPATVVVAWVGARAGL